jgi:tetratricopeptide (TPR) repeat protein
MPAPRPALLQTSPAFTARARRLDLLFCAGLCLLALVVYFPGIYGDFIPIDDDVELMTNLNIREFSWAHLRWMFTDTHLTLRYTPLSWVAWAVIYALTGPGPHPEISPPPLPYHVYGLLVHAVNVGLVYFVVRAVVRQVRRLRHESASPLDAPFTALATALWAFHPLRVEVVSWATQVRYGESQACALAAFLWYDAAVRRLPTPAAPLARQWRFWAAVAAFAASILFYPQVIGLAALLPVLDVYLFRRVSPAAVTWRDAVRLCLEKAPFFLAAVAAGVMTIIGRFAPGTIWGTPATLDQFPWTSRAMQATWVLVYYLWKPLDPTHISPIYARLYEFNAWDPPFIAAYVAWGAFTVAALVLRRRHPWLFLFWAAHHLLLVPVGGYFDHPHITVDRYAYTHNVLFAAYLACALGWAWPRMTRLARRTLAGAACAAAIVFALLSAAQTRVWTNGESVYLHVLGELGDHPQREEIYWKLANWYVVHGYPEQAIEWGDKSLAIKPRGFVVRAIKVQALAELARRNDAAGGPPATTRRLCAAAARLLDEMCGINARPDSYLQAATFYRRAGLLDPAEDRYRRGLALAPDVALAHFGLADILFAKGQREEALGHLNRAAELDPSFAVQRDAVLRSLTPAPPPPPPAPLPAPAPPPASAPAPAARPSPG